jgi:DNA primase
LLDAWNAQRLHTLEQCLARLLEDDTPPTSSPAVDMDLRLRELFEVLNRDALRLQAEYYAERRHLLELDQHRCAELAEIVRTP